VVVVSGVTVTLPVVATLPTPLSIEQEEQFSVRHESTDAPPSSIDPGEAVKEETTTCFEVSPPWLGLQELTRKSIKNKKGVIKKITTLSLVILCLKHLVSVILLISPPEYIKIKYHAQLTLV
jgi:hypothetical protein